MALILYVTRLVWCHASICSNTCSSYSKHVIHPYLAWFVASKNLGWCLTTVRCSFNMLVGKCIFYRFLFIHTHLLFWRSQVSTSSRSNGECFHSSSFYSSQLHSCTAQHTHVGTTTAFIYALKETVKVCRYIWLMLRSHIFILATSCLFLKKSNWYIN